MSTLEDLMATGMPDRPNPRRQCRTLTAMAVAAIAITLAAITAFAISDLPQLFARHNRSQAVAPADHPTSAP
jgi:hypothetical protein